MNSILLIALSSVLLLITAQDEALAASPATLPTAQQTTSRWAIDRGLKFQIVYLPTATDAGLTQTSTNLVPELNTTPAFRPDITNITYSALPLMGFPLPQRSNADKLKLYLKLFKWPRHLNATISSRKALNPFFITMIPGGDEIEKFISSSVNVLLKYASIEPYNREFSAQHPLDVRLPTHQSNFDSMVPFSSLYVRPQSGPPKNANEKSRVEHSAEGVRVIHRALIDLYTRVFQKFGDETDHVFFIDPQRCPTHPEQVCGAHLYTLPQKPLVFANYRDLPMPQDPQNVFLSGLLLIRYAEFAARSPISASTLASLSATAPEFLSSFLETRSHLLEVGSVFDRKLRSGKVK